MEAKCELDRRGILTQCSCDQTTRELTCEKPSTGQCSPLYWAHATRININNSKLSSSSVNTGNCYSEPKDSFKDMGSWRYPATACLSPCVSARRLNRPYSEQRLRCFFVTIIAFCLGISVGALFPLFYTFLQDIPQPQATIFVDSVNPSKPDSQPLQYASWTTTYKESTPSFIRAMQTLEEVESNPSISPVLNVNNSLFNLPDEKESATQKIVPLVEGIYWSDWVERLIPQGFSNQDVANWRSLVGNSTVTAVEAGCGRMQNRLVTYQNGKQGCCRYRQNFDQIQGEIFSFYLSQLLGINNLAPSTLDVIDSKSNKWIGVQDDLEAASWVDEKPVVLTQFVNNLEPAFIPPLLRSSTRRVHPPDLAPLTVSLSKDSENVNLSDKREFSEISDLAQWSDLIIFDYLTANLDRMVNNLYNLQWNPSMMEAPAHNLAKEISTGLLVFLDNESGLLHGYRLLDKYEHYHRLMLDSLCVFRKTTVEAIERLHAYGSIQPVLKSMLSQYTNSQLLPMIPDKSIKILNQRIDTVYRQIQKCQSLYSNITVNNSSSSKKNAGNNSNYNNANSITHN